MDPSPGGGRAALLSGRGGRVVACSERPQATSRTATTPGSGQGRGAKRALTRSVPGGRAPQTSGTEVTGRTSAGLLSVRGLADVQGIRDPDRLAWLLGPEQPLEPLLAAAHQLSREGHGDRVSYSPKAFLPLTQLCRDNCGYCPCAQPPL